MPEIDFCLFDLGYLFKLFKFEDKTLEISLKDYERQAQEDMAQIRVKLFT